VTIGYASGNTNAQTMADLVSAQLDALGLKATSRAYQTSTVFGWINDPPKGPDVFIDGNNGPDGGNPYMWGHVFWDAKGGINYFGCDLPTVDAALDSAVKTGDTAQFVSAAEEYSANGCYLNLSYNKDWVVAQKWVGGIPGAQDVGANELDFSKLTITKG
jgi:peptide/nickel transport system substrate-binding protein